MRMSRLVVTREKMRLAVIGFGKVNASLDKIVKGMLANVPIEERL